MKTLIVILVLLSSSVFAEGFKCIVEKKMSCKESGCTNAELLSDDYRFIDVNDKTIRLGTDAPLAIKETSRSGLFVFIKFGGAAFIKIASMDEPLSEIEEGDFFESRDGFLGTILSWGKCDLS